MPTDTERLDWLDSGIPHYDGFDNVMIELLNSMFVQATFVRSGYVIEHPEQYVGMTWREAIDAVMKGEGASE